MSQLDLARSATTGAVDAAARRYRRLASKEIAWAQRKLTDPKALPPPDWLHGYIAAMIQVKTYKLRRK